MGSHKGLFRGVDLHHFFNKYGQFLRNHNYIIWFVKIVNPYSSSGGWGVQWHCKYPVFFLQPFCSNYSQSKLLQCVLLTRRWQQKRRTLIPQPTVHFTVTQGVKKNQVLLYLNPWVVKNLMKIMVNVSSVLYQIKIRNIIIKI